MTGRLVFEWMVASVVVIGLGLWAIDTAGSQVKKAAANIGSDFSD